MNTNILPLDTITAAEAFEAKGAHFICHETTIAGTGDAICAGWYDRFSESDPLLVMADRMGVIDRTTEPKGTP